MSLSEDVRPVAEVDQIGAWSKEMEEAFERGLRVIGEGLERFGVPGLTDTWNALRTV